MAIKDMKDGYCTPSQASKLSRVAIRTLTKWFDQGKIAGFVLPDSKHRRINIASLKEFLFRNNIPTDLIK